MQFIHDKFVLTWNQNLPSTPSPLDFDDFRTKYMH